MSSIYKKGRDGYFYYQTYLRDKSTGLKTKKIFHSLGTKSFSEAKKQIAYDKRYSESEKTSKYKKIFLEHKLLICIVFVNLTFMIVLYNMLSVSSKDTFSILQDPSNGTYLSSPISSTTSDLDTTISTDELVSDISEKKDFNIVFEDSNYLSIPKEDMVLPKYTIHRVDELSDSFSQAKMFLTVDPNSSSDALLKLCEVITLKNSNYSNLVICLYADNKIGREIAKSSGSKALIIDSPKSWIAMYSYNKVEGVYFDDNPTQFISGF